MRLGSQSEWVRVGKLASEQTRRPFEGTHRARLVEPHILVELPRKARVEIVALELRFRTVHDADGALEERWGGELFAHRAPAGVAQVQSERAQVGVMKESLVAAIAPRHDAHALHRFVPIMCGGHRAVVCAESDDVRLFAEEVSTELADVVLAPRAHLRR